MLSYPDGIRRRWEAFCDNDAICFCEMGHIASVRKNDFSSNELFSFEETATCDCGRPIVRSMKKLDLRRALASFGGGPIWNYYGGSQRVRTDNGGWVYFYSIKINYFFDDFHFPGVQ